MTRDAETRLATYGTLAPGQINERELAELDGTWISGEVRGRLVDAGWGAALGCPGIVVDPSGEPVAVQVFTSPDLPDHWDRLDAFEGPGYRRVSTPVQTTNGVIQASIYELEPGD